VSKRDRWDRTGRNPQKVVKEIRRTARQRDIELVERQKGSHWIGKVPGKGSVVVPQQGEIPKGTLELLGLAIIILGACYIVNVLFGG
jgi:hypothetical protein